MIWPAVITLVAGVALGTVVGAMAYVAHVRDHTPPRGAVGSHRAVVTSGRHRPGPAGPVGGSVARLRAREHAEGMRMYPGGSGRP